MLYFVQEHILKCDYEDILCPAECGKRVAKSLLEKHLNENCPRRQVECEHCQTKVPISELQVCSCFYYVSLSFLLSVKIEFLSKNITYVIFPFAADGAFFKRKIYAVTSYLYCFLTVNSHAEIHR